MCGEIRDTVVQHLIDSGVDTIFGPPGDGVDGMHEALRTRKDKLRFIQVRHEEAPALAASDPNEPPLPGNIDANQALHFAEALAKAEKDRGTIIKTIAVEKSKR